MSKFNPKLKKIQETQRRQKEKKTICSLCKEKENEDNDKERRLLRRVEEKPNGKISNTEIEPKNSFPSSPSLFFKQKQKYFLTFTK